MLMAFFEKEGERSVVICNEIDFAAAVRNCFQSFVEGHFESQREELPASREQLKRGIVTSDQGSISAVTTEDAMALQ